MICKRLLVIAALVVFGACPLSTVFAVDYDLADDANWNIRIDGTTGGYGNLGKYQIASGDVNNDGDDDLIVTEFSSNYLNRLSTISYVIYNELLSSYTSTGNTIDLTDTATYNFRVIGGADDEYSPYYSVSLADLNGNGLQDMMVSSSYASQSGVSKRGALYVLYDSLLDDFTGTGQTIDLSNASNYNFKFLGVAADDEFGAAFSSSMDLNDDGRKDLVITAHTTDNNGRSNSGSTYVIYSSLLDSYGVTTGNLVSMGTTSNFNIRLDGPEAGAYQETYILGDNTDLDNDGKDDLIIFNPLADNNGRDDSGSGLILFSSLLSAYVGTGNIVDLADDANWNIRIDGSEEGSSNFGFSITYVGDVNGDGDADLVLGDSQTGYNGREYSGSVYILDNGIISGIVGTGNTLDLSDSDSFTARFDGAIEDANAGYDPWLFDYDNDGKKDLIFEECCAGGTIFVVNNNTFGSLTSTGNVFDMADADNYSHSYAVVSSAASVPYAPMDVNGDGKQDFVLNDMLAGNNGRVESGSVYIIYNFPHTIDVDSVSSAEITGTVSASDSATSVVGVQYVYNDDSPTSSAWTDCAGTTTFTCTLEGVPAGPSVDVYLRAYDTNISYTAQENYAHETLSIAVAQSTRRSGSSVASRPTVVVPVSPPVPGTNPLVESPTVYSPYLFQKNLMYGMIDPEVKQLQEYLNRHGFLVSTSGAGSLNQETNFFGVLTRSALIKFQEAHAAEVLTPLGLVRGTGFFGPSTRAYINK